jgi:septum site-determining protein MinC
MIRMLFTRGESPGSFAASVACSYWYRRGLSAVPIWMGCATPFPELRVTRNTVQSETRPRPVRFRGRSYLAFSLAPEPPIADWLVDLDAAIDRSSGFFVGRPAVLDLGNTALSQSAIALLIQELEARHIRIMGIEGAEAANLGPGLPPVLVSGRPASGGELARVAQEAQDKPAPKPAEQQSGSLVVDTPVRSGQTIYNSAGDVVVIGSVAWGAEVVASGSVHIYGVLRGRALAGATGNTKARIFCRKLEAELLAIAGYYRTVDDIESDLRNRPVQAWLDGNAMLIAALD